MRKLIICFLTVSSINVFANLENAEDKQSYNLPAGIDVDGANVSVSGEFLYWIAQENGLFYSQDIQSEKRNAGIIDDVDISILSIRGDLNKIKPKFDPGFRIKIGRNIPYDKWDAYFSWTRFRTKKTDQTTNNALALWGHTGREIADFWQFSKAYWYMNYDELELQLGRASYLGSCFSFRPYAALVGTRITQKLSIVGDWIDVGNRGGNDFIRVKSDFIGGGIRSGIDLDFIFNKNFSLFSIAAGSINYGRFDLPYYVTQQITKDSNNPVDIKTILADSSYRFHQNINAARLGLGLKYSSYFGKNKNHFIIKTGWEQNIWFGINKMRHYLRRLKDAKLRIEHNNLSLQGIDINARLDF
ncbi:MAG: hypothetical protein JXA94_07445 [Parachlamydiales bacterium]|nr:hypothetical protein [Parachlamydiales bacterium]